MQNLVIMGRDVHGSDMGWDWRLPLEPGQALTIEPGFYVASEGTGLRIEDDYWVGPIGLECLSCPLVPRWPEDVEAVMAAGRARPSAAAPPTPPEPLPVSPYGLDRPHMQPREEGGREPETPRR